MAVSVQQAVHRLALLTTHLLHARETASTATNHAVHAQQTSRSSTTLPPLKKQTAARAVIVGGAVLDIQAVASDFDVQRGTSVPGHVRQIPGGVARNLAEGLSRLLEQDASPTPLFISCVGDDAAGSLLISELKQLHLDLSGVIIAKDTTTACVAVVLDRSGEVAAAVADVSCVEAVLTPTRLSRFKPHIQAAALVLVETNLTTDALQAVCGYAAEAGVQVYMEPVSVAKALRCVPVLPLLTFIKPNTAELLSMALAVCKEEDTPPPTGPLESEWAGHMQMEKVLQQCARLAEVLLRRGVKYIFLTLGSQGAALICLDSNAEPARSHMPCGVSGGPLERPPAVYLAHMPALPAEVVSLTGAGDSLVFGSAAALLRGASPLHALAYGIAAARHAVQVSQNVPVGLSLSRLQADASEALSGLTEYRFQCGPSLV